LSANLVPTSDIGRALSNAGFIPSIFEQEFLKFFDQPAQELIGNTIAQDLSRSLRLALDAPGDTITVAGATFDRQSYVDFVTGEATELVLLSLPDFGPVTAAFERLIREGNDIILDARDGAHRRLDDAIEGRDPTPASAGRDVESAIAPQPGPSITATLQDTIDSTLDAALDVPDSLPGETADAVEDTVDSTVQAQVDRASGIGAFIDTLLDTPLSIGLESLQNLIRQFTGTPEGAVNESDTIELDLERTIFESAESVFRDFSLPDFNIPDLLDDLLGGALDAGQSVLDEVIETVTNPVDSLLDAVIGGFDQIGRGALNVLDGVFGDIDLTVADIELRTDSVADAVNQHATVLRDTMNVLGERMLTSLPGGDFINSTRVAAAEIERDFGRVNDALKQAANLDGALSTGCDLALRALENLQFENPHLQLLIDVLKGFFTVQSLMLRILDAQSQRCLQEWAVENPYRILEPGDAVTAHHRGFIAREDAEFILRQHGFDANLARILVDSGHTIPQSNLTIGMWLRGIIDDAEVDRALFAEGFEPEWIVRLKEAAFFVPQVQDLITMAVREVFNAEQVQALTLDAEFPEEFAEQAALQGVSRDWAEKFWQAHWQLPSAQMGFQMLHRGVIDESELGDLLKALDLAPVWRDRIQAISFAPFTRVDIRRMHALGILDREAVVRAHKDIGYDDTKAEQLTDFVVALNAPEDDDDEVQVRDLTRAQIIGFFEDGVFDRATAFALLQQAGISAAVATLFLTQSQLEQERRDRREQTDILIDRFSAGSLSFNEAQDALANLGLEPLELDRARLALRRAAERQVNVPSRADLDRFVAAGLITTEQYLEQMARAGWSEFWAERFLSLATES